MIRAAFFAAVMATSLHAQEAIQEYEEDPGEAARIAALELEDAAILLDKAKGSSDRVEALTDTVRAFEAGLGAMRDGLRQASVREDELMRALQAQEGEVAQLLGVLQVMAQRTAIKGTLHPDGPVNTVRAGILVTAVTPEVVRKANVLRAQLEEVTLLRDLQEQAAERLRTGLSQVQQARTALSQAVADRTDLPQRFTEDPAQVALLIAATETLSGFATGLTQIEEGDTAPEGFDVEARRGTLLYPVTGTLLRGYNEPDAAGVARPGLVLATAEGALVTTPATATLRYRGPLLNYGLVSILEPAEDFLIVLAGLGTVYGETGQVLPAGTPVGLMGGTDGDILSQSGEGLGERAGNLRPETLYIEVREGETPVNPLDWFLTR